jgi:hypothetical protein
MYLINGVPGFVEILHGGLIKVVGRFRFSAIQYSCTTKPPLHKTIRELFMYDTNRYTDFGEM